MKLEAINSFFGIQKTVKARPDKVQKYIQNSKHFCLPIYKIDLTKAEYFANASENVNWVKVFTNPKARELYNKAQAVLKEPDTNFESLNRASKLFAEMGEYTIVDLDQEEALDTFCKLEM